MDGKIIGLVIVFVLLFILSFAGPIRSFLWGPPDQENTAVTEPSQLSSTSSLIAELQAELQQIRERNQALERIIQEQEREIEQLRMRLTEFQE